MVENENPNSEKNPNTLINWVIFLLVFLLIGGPIIYSFFSEKSSEQNKYVSFEEIQRLKQDSIKKGLLVDQEAIDKKEKTKNLESALGSIIKKDSEKSWPIATSSELESIQKEIIFYQLLSKQIHQAEKESGLKRKAVLAGLKLARIQKNRLPRLRKLWAQLLDDRAWEEDGNFEIVGKNNSILVAIHRSFVTNKGKLAGFEALRPMANDLRFRQIRFKWYEKQDEYTYWDVSSDPDSKLIDMRD